MSRQSFTSEQAGADLVAILDFIKKAHSATVKQISDATGLPRNKVTGYLQHLRQEELVKVSGGLRSAGQVKSWVLGTDPAVVAALQPKRIVKQQWEPNHVRMAFECFFFGVPAALQGATA